MFGRKDCYVCLVTILMPCGLLAQSHQSATATNVIAMDSFVNMTTTSSLCLNTYAFDPSGEMVACCSASVSPGQTYVYSVRNDVASNTLTGVVPNAIDFRLVTTAAGSCNAGIVSTLAEGLTARLSPVQGSGGATFEAKSLSTELYNSYAAKCPFVQTNGGGYGICKALKTFESNAVLATPPVQLACPTCGKCASSGFLPVAVSLACPFCGTFSSCVN